MQLVLWNYNNQEEKLKHLKAGNHMHSSDEETARQTKRFNHSFTASGGGKKLFDFRRIQEFIYLRYIYT